MDQCALSSPAMASIATPAWLAASMGRVLLARYRDAGEAQLIHSIVGSAEINTMVRKRGSVVQSERLRDQIYRLIRDDLRVGALAPGERLKEVSLAKTLGVSRTPVREALFQLASDGLLVEADRGYMLPVHTIDEIRDRLEIRKLLEPEILRRACRGVSDTQVEALQQALEREKKYVDTKDPGKYIGANADFRQALLALCDNKLLANCAALYDDQFQCFRVWGLQAPANRKATADSHEKVVRAIIENKPELAEKSFQQLMEKVDDMLSKYEKDVLE